MYQMTVLLLFNDSSELTIEQIHDQTQIKLHLLLSVLNSLIASKILTCIQPLNLTNLDMNCKITLSDEFRW